MSEEPSKPSFGDVVSAAGFAIGLVTAWLYAAGWTYAYVYFDRFRIPLLMLDIPSEHMLVYGGLVIRKNFWLALLCSALLIAALWALALWSRRLGRFAVSAAVVLLIVVTFALGRSAGRSAALADFAQERATDYAAYPRVRLAWTGTDAPPDSVLADLRKSDCGRLLATSKEQLFLIRPVQGAAGLDLDTFVISRKKVEALRLRADYASCP